MAKTGDLVRYLNSVGGGTITRIDGNIAYVDEDGFETPVLLKECVVVSPASTHVPPPSYNFGPKQPQAPASPKAPTPAPQPQPKQEETFVVEETPEGEKLNVVLAYEAADIKRLSTTSYDTYLVNDSNYYLSAAYLTRSEDSDRWTLRWAGTIEPGIQLFLGELRREDIAEVDRVAVQYLAFKKGKEFPIKSPASVEHKLDNTKFFKLHCFQPNIYFDQPVIALTIVENDIPARQPVIDARELERGMKQKAGADRRMKAPVKKHPKKGADEPLVVDLHINELVDSTRGLSNADMLNLQVDRFCKVMDENLRNHGRKIVFIHGKGDGVLRAAILKELNYRYKGHDVQDASFQEYGYGATQVKIR